MSQCHRCGEIDGEVDADAIGSQDIRYLLHLAQVLLREHLRRRIDIIQHRAVDTDGRIGTGIVTYQLFVEVEPLEDTLPCIAPLDRPVQVIPVVQQSQFEFRTLCPVDDRHVRGLQAQCLISPIEQSYVMTCRDYQQLVGAVEGESLVVGQGRVYAQHDAVSLEIVLQFLLGDVDGL